MRGTPSMMTALLLTTALLGGCSSKATAPPAASGVRVGDVGSIVVTYASSISAADRKLLDEVNGGPRLKTAIESELAKAAKLRSGSPRVLEVELTEFRLRSGATVFWTGILSGVDTLQIQVKVRDGGRVVRQFATGDSTGGGISPTGFSSSNRYQIMADAVAERLRDEL